MGVNRAEDGGRRSQHFCAFTMSVVVDRILVLGIASAKKVTGLRLPYLVESAVRARGSA